jgi:glycine/D-amino acid oxidase-like deaminating enzyme
MNSIWKAKVQMPHFSPLEGEHHTDVLVIGGGMAGLLCAFHLKRAGVECILIEQDRIMSGVSGLTTAKLTVQHGLIYSRLLKEFGTERAQLYWQANRDAVKRLSALAEEADCDFTRQSSYLYTTGVTERLEEEMEAYHRLGISAQWKSSLTLPFPVTGAIEIREQAQFHPMKLAAYIAKDLPIYENTKALSFCGNRVQTPKGTVTADKMIVATHFPLVNKHGSYFLKLYQQRSYVIALENGTRPEGMYLDCAANGLSIRCAGPWLLLGVAVIEQGKREWVGNYRN